MRLINACALQEEYKARHGGKRLLLIDVAPTVDAVPVGAYKQVRWERDIAMQQLDALGYGLGEKVVPVVHGRWIVHYGNWADVYECDQCHHASKDGGKYCSNCGARMDGKQL